MEIRIINSNEVRLLEEGCKEFYSTGAIPGELDINSWRDHWKAAIDKGYGKVWAAFNDTGDAVAALGGYIGPDQSNFDTIFTERFFFARNVGRGTGLKLLKQAEQDLINDGVDRIYMINLLNYQTEKTTKLYSLLGYRPAEVLWVKEV